MRGIDGDESRKAGPRRAFCDAHGYRNAVGTSQRPAMAVGHFDSALHAVHQRDIDARYADVMSVDNLIAYSTRSHSRAQQPI